LLEMVEKSNQLIAEVGGEIISSAIRKPSGKGPDARKVFRLEPRTIKARYPVAELTQQPNPFKGVSLTKVAAIAAVTTETTVPMHLIDSIRLRGLKRALKPLSKEQQKRIKAVFADPTACLLPDTDELWKIWPDVLIACGSADLDAVTSAPKAVVP
jgi:hypothetical protein